MKGRPFLIWVLMTSLVYTGVFWLWWFGIAENVLTTDKTFITVLIFAMFTWINFRIGQLAYKAQYLYMYNKEALFSKLERYEMRADRLIQLGLIGTGIGLILMAIGVDWSSITLDNKRGLLEAIQTVPVSLGTALYTTVSGLISVWIINKQIDFVVDSIEDDDDTEIFLS